MLTLHRTNWPRRIVYLALPLALVMAAAVVARAFDTTWIMSGSPLSSMKLKSTLDTLASPVVGGQYGSPNVSEAAAGNFAHLTLNAPEAGFALVHWSADVSIASGSNCTVVVTPATTAHTAANSDPWSVQLYLAATYPNGNYPMAGTALFPVTQGANTIYLNGGAAANCAGSGNHNFSRISMTATFHPNAIMNALTVP